MESRSIAHATWLVLGFLENLFFLGFAYGFTFIEYILKNEGAFYNYSCLNGTTRFNLIKVRVIFKMLGDFLTMSNFVQKHWSYTILCTLV